MLDEILMSIAKLAPVVAVLVAAVWYFLNKEKKYQKQIEDLNQQLRQNEKESLELMVKLAATMDKFVDSDHRNKEEIIKELKSLEKTLVTRIDALK